MIGLFYWTLVQKSPIIAGHICWTTHIENVHYCLTTHAVCCSALQCAAVCCSVLQCAAVCCSVLQCVAVCCSVLQHVAVCSVGLSWLQYADSHAHTHTHKSSLQTADKTNRVRSNTLQHTATHCNTLQHTATHRQDKF